MNKIRPFLAAKFALPISIWGVVFSLAMLVALIFFVDDVASVLTVYFELSADQKWQIISKFTTPLLIALGTLLCFNAVTILLCTFYSTRLFGTLDTMLKWVDLILVGEDRHLNPPPYSAQSAALSRKLWQLQEELAHSRNLSRGLRKDLKTIEHFLHALQSSDTQPQPLTLTAAPEVAAQLNELAAHLSPPSIDRAQ